MPCARLSWPFCQLLSARKYLVSYRIMLNRLQSVFNAAAHWPPSLGAHFICSRQFPLASSASSSNWRSSYTELFTVLHSSTYRVSCSTLLIFRRGRLHSSTSSLLDVRPSRLVTVGDRSFAAAGPRLWNSLFVDVKSSPSLTPFRQKTENTFIPAIIPRQRFGCFAIVVLEVTFN